MHNILNLVYVGVIVTEVRGLCCLRGTGLGLDVTHGLIDLGVLRVTVTHLIAGTRRELTFRVFT